MHKPPWFLADKTRGAHRGPPNTPARCATSRTLGGEEEGQEHLPDRFPLPDLELAPVEPRQILARELAEPEREDAQLLRLGPLRRLLGPGPAVGRGVLELLGEDLVDLILVGRGRTDPPSKSRPSTTPPSTSTAHLLEPRGAVARKGAGC